MITFCSFAQKIAAAEKMIRYFLLLSLFSFSSWICSSKLQGAEQLPPPPHHYFNDETGIISPAVATKLNDQLAAFDQQTSNQVVVLVAASFSASTSLDSYAQQLYSAWHLGTKKKSNGVLLVVFLKKHLIRIQTGYGLEGALPDVVCKRIIEEIMIPHFEQQNPNEAMIAGVQAILRATAHEYKNDSLSKKKKSFSWVELLLSPFSFFLFIMIISFLLRNSRGVGGLSSGGGWFFGGSGNVGSSGGDDWGNFSGGGGESGGGGADGSW